MNGQWRKLVTHLVDKYREIDELDEIGRGLPGRLPAVVLALKQQALIQLEVAEAAAQQDPSRQRTLACSIR